MTEEELAKHNSKTLLQLLLSSDARCDALTAERDRLRHAIRFWLEAQEPDVDAAINMMRAALKGETT